MKKQIRGIVWDVGRVLLDIDIRRGVEMLAERYAQPFEAVWEFVTASPEFHDFERGACFYDEFVTACNGRFRGSIDTVTFARIMEGQMIGSKSDVLALRDELRTQGVFQATASNVNSVHHTWILRQHPEVFNGVDFIGASFQLQVRKGDPDFFPVLLGRINACRNGQGALSFEELVFVDDIHNNLVQAAVHNIRPVHFDPDHPHAVARLREELVRFGLPVKQIDATSNAVGESSTLSA